MTVADVSIEIERDSNLIQITDLKYESGMATHCGGHLHNMDFSQSYRKLLSSLFGQLYNLFSIYLVR